MSQSFDLTRRLDNSEVLSNKDSKYPTPAFEDEVKASISALLVCINKANTNPAASYKAKISYTYLVDFISTCSNDTICKAPSTPLSVFSAVGVGV